jgi:hypothetical protein
VTTHESSSVQTLLTSVLEADRALRDAQEAFLSHSDERALANAVAAEVDRAWDAGDDPAKIGRLICLAELLAEVGGPGAARTLLRLLGHEEPNVRAAAGDGLLDLGEDRYAEVARAIETEVEKGTDIVALREVPFLLAELGEPGGVKLCARLLKHADADVVGAAIMGLAQLSDPSVLKDLDALRSDRRPLEAVEDADAEATVGDLATEASEHLRSLARALQGRPDGDAPRPGRRPG